MRRRLERPGCTVLFNESIRSEYTRKNYGIHLSQFQRFAGMSSADELAHIPHEDMQALLENYVLELKHSTNPNSVPSKFQGIRHFCVINGIRIDWDIIRKMFPQRQRPPALRAYTTGEIRTMLSHTAGARDVALIHFLISTGTRIGVFGHELLMGHTRRMSYGCRAVRLYAGEIEEYWTFLTPQASSALDLYHDCRKRAGESFTTDTPLFTARGPSPRQLTWNGARSAIYRTITRSNITRIKDNGRYDVQADHGFRKRFNTILKLDNSINYNIAEKLMGHKNGLDGMYFVPTLEELFAEFKKVMRKLEV